jgi:hypothetical protein
MMKSPLRVVIVDDETERSKGWAASILALGIQDVTVEALELAEAQLIIQSADARRRVAREGKDPFSSTSILECKLDDVDILIVDYDLQELLEVGKWSTGLQVSTLARAFTRTKVIVLVNQFGTNSFDLTLVKSSQSRSDFDIGSGQILNPAFWDRSNVDGYSPWAWNDGVIQAAYRMEAVVEWMKENLDKPVLSTLGFSIESEDSEQPNYLGYELWQEIITSSNQTFRQLVEKSEFLAQKDRECILSYDEPCARVAAAIISHWFERTVIPANETLIDIPHLVSFYPWLLRSPEDVESWQATTSGKDAFNATLEELGDCVFDPGFPLARPVVWKQKVLQTPELAEPAGFSYDNFPDMVFCEDASRFHEFSDSRPFQSRLPGGDPQRFVANPGKVTDATWKHALADVNYEPSVLFAL